MPEMIASKLSLETVFRASEVLVLMDGDVGEYDLGNMGEIVGGSVGILDKAIRERTSIG